MLEPQCQEAFGWDAAVACAVEAELLRVGGVVGNIEAVEEYRFVCAVVQLYPTAVVKRRIHEHIHVSLLNLVDDDSFGRDLVGTDGDEARSHQILVGFGIYADGRHSRLQSRDEAIVIHGRAVRVAAVEGASLEGGVGRFNGWNQLQRLALYQLGLVDVEAEFCGPNHIAFPVELYVVEGNPVGGSAFSADAKGEGCLVGVELHAEVLRSAIAGVQIRTGLAGAVGKEEVNTRDRIIVVILGYGDDIGFQCVMANGKPFDLLMDGTVAQWVGIIVALISPCLCELRYPAIAIVVGGALIPKVLCCRAVIVDDPSLGGAVEVGIDDILVGHVHPILCEQRCHAEQAYRC